MRARPDVGVRSWDVAQGEPLLQEALRHLLRCQPFDLEAREARLRRPGRSQGDAGHLGELFQKQFGAVTDPLETHLSSLVDRLRSRSEAGGEGRTRRRGFEASRVPPQLVVTLRVEGERVGEGEEPDVRTVDVETGPDV